MPHRHELSAILSGFGERMHRRLEQNLSESRSRIEGVRSRWAFRRPLDLIREFRLRLDDAARTHQSALLLAIRNRRSETEILNQKIRSLNPQAVLDRGFSVVTRSTDGRSVKDASELETGARVRMRFARGGASGWVESLEIPEETAL